ncbi:MAG TPA: NAD(P)H-dependent oxidoreductase [Acholeplasma sp.]|jgi:NAD(P)H-dependent FMN reductase
MSFNIGIIIASIREGRKGQVVAEWVAQEAQKRNLEGINYTILDLKEYDLPMLGKVLSNEELERVNSWKNDMNAMDAYIIVTPEYNHGAPGSLVNAFQYLKPEVANKSLGFVGYGFVGATRAIVNFRTQLVYQQLAIVQQQINLNLNLDFSTKDNTSVFEPKDYHLPEVDNLLNQLITWGKALKTTRSK